MHHRCPDEETLAAWFDGLLPEKDRAVFHQGLMACTQCSHLVAALGLVVDDAVKGDPSQWIMPPKLTRQAQNLWPSEPSESPLRLAVQWIGERLAPLADALTPRLTPAMAVRGAVAPQEELSYHITLGGILLELNLETDGPAQIALSVRPVYALPDGLILRLTTQGETRAMSSLTAAGSQVPALPHGEYELTLEQAGKSLGQLALSLN